MRYITFDAPSAAEAYSDAPDLDAEIQFLLRTTASMAPAVRPADALPPYTPEIRELALRTAAAADRLCWRERSAEAARSATERAVWLMDFDREHPSGAAGPIGPDSIEWGADGGPRAYCRQEYLAWLTNGPRFFANHRDKKES